MDPRSHPLPDHARGPLAAGLDLPWVANNDPDPRIVWSDSLMVADFRTPWISKDKATANARRLVALWNACLDLDTAVLEQIATTRDPVARLEYLAKAAASAAREHAAALVVYPEPPEGSA